MLPNAQERVQAIQERVTTHFFCCEGKAILIPYASDSFFGLFWLRDKNAIGSALRHELVRTGGAYRPNRGRAKASDDNSC